MRTLDSSPFSPVAISSRADGWTPERQWRFVEALSVTASVTQAARVVGVSARSAQRLLRHPEAAAFRAAWDEALAQVWQQLDQNVLDRAVNGDREFIEREGFVVMERKRPCSDRLMIHLLNTRERAMAELRIEAIIAAKAAPRCKRGKAGDKAPPPAPVLLDDAGAETAALAAFAAQADAFAEWPSMEDAGDYHITPPPPLAAALMAAAEAAAHARAAKLVEIAAEEAREADELDNAARREAAMHAWQAAES